MRRPGFCKAEYAIAFGLGLVLSCFCPTGVMMFVLAVIILYLGVARCRR